MSQKEESEVSDAQADAVGATVTPSVTPAAEQSPAPSDGDRQTAQSGSLAELQAALAAAERRAEASYSDMLRVRAEMENFRKRAARDVENAHKFALERFLTDLIPVNDSLELGLNAAGQATDVAAVREGMGLTLKLLNELLQKSGVEAVDPVDEKFNPEVHQAMSMQEAPGKEPGTVLMVLQKGYLLNGRLLRPAMVIVAK